MTRIFVALKGAFTQNLADGLDGLAKAASSRVRFAVSARWVDTLTAALSGSTPTRPAGELAIEAHGPDEARVLKEMRELLVRAGVAEDDEVERMLCGADGDDATAAQDAALARARFRAIHHRAEDRVVEAADEVDEILKAPWADEGVSEERVRHEWRRRKAATSGASRSRGTLLGWLFPPLGWARQRMSVGQVIPRLAAIAICLAIIFMPSPFRKPTNRTKDVVRVRVESYMQSYVAIGSGGPVGLGLGEGTKRYHFLPGHVGRYDISIMLKPHVDVASDGDSVDLVLWCGDYLHYLAARNSDRVTMLCVGAPSSEALPGLRCSTSRTYGASPVDALLHRFRIP